MDSLQKNHQKPADSRSLSAKVSRDSQAPLCATRNLGKSFPGVRALQGVSLGFRAGRVHALMGENGAGKSTLLKCLFGIYTPDEGEILLDGVPIRFHGPRDAMAHGLAMVHQELHPIRDMNVMENLWLGRMPRTSLGFVDFKTMEQESRRLFEEWHLDLDPRQRVGDLSVSKIQSLEIAKAIFAGAKILIMDEPTSSLSEKEVLALYSTIDRLRDQGTALIYISHKMDEIKRLADDITVMRDGRVVGTFEASQISRDQVISLMVGRELTQLFPEKSLPVYADPDRDILLRVDHVGHQERRPQGKPRVQGHGKVLLENIHFTLRKGEILGVGGLVGSGRSELLKGLFGLMPFKTGTVFVQGKPLALTSPEMALRSGIGYLSEDRREEGIFPQLSIIDNLIMSCQERFMKMPFWIDGARRLQETEKAIKTFQIKTPSPQSQIVNLSGGNQQKVLLARALMTNPRVLLLDEPTRGIDVGAKHEIYLLIQEFVGKGGCVVVVSSELPELIGLAHRVLMLCDGRQAALLEGEDLTETQLMKAATLYH